MSLIDMVNALGTWVGTFLIPSFFIVTPLAILVHVVNSKILPRTLKQHYLTQPWFSKGECLTYNAGPGALVFAWLVSLAICLPELRGRHRNMQDIRSFSPSWFKAMAVVHVFLVCLLLLKIIVMLVYFGLYQLLIAA